MPQEKAAEPRDTRPAEEIWDQSPSGEIAPGNNDMNSFAKEIADERKRPAHAAGGVRFPAPAPGHADATGDDAGGGVDREEAGPDQAGPRGEDAPPGEGRDAGRGRPRRSGSHSRGPSAERGEVRARIREAARGEFVDRGYDATTMRSVARRAGCDSAMVSYYFGSKQRLFRECMNLPLDPAEESIAQLSQGIDGAGERLLRYALSLYRERITGDTMLALMRALITDAATSQRFRAYFRHDVLGQVTAFFGEDSDLEEQIELLLSMMYGIATMRYVVRLEPLASLPDEDLVAQVAPLVQERLNRMVRTAQES